jgi:hypothetical protein
MVGNVWRARYRSGLNATVNDSFGELIDTVFAFTAVKNRPAESPDGQPPVAWAAGQRAWKRASSPSLSLSNQRPKARVGERFAQESSAAQ